MILICICNALFFVPSTQINHFIHNNNNRDEHFITLHVNFIRLSCYRFNKPKPGKCRAISVKDFIDKTLRFIYCKRFDWWWVWTLIGLLRGGSSFFETDSSDSDSVSSDSLVFVSCEGLKFDY